MASVRPAPPLIDDLRTQLELMEGRAPSCRRVLEALATLLTGPEGAALERRFEKAWFKRTFSVYYERPLLLLAALRYDAIAEGEAHPLHAALRSDRPDAEAVTVERILAAFAPERLGIWMTLRTRRVQTNETKRSVVWRWPAAVVGCDERGRPVTLVDVGASAGLNLVADAVDIAWTSTDGEPIPVARALDVRSRAAFDLRPLDVRKSGDRQWLEACIWPGETERIAHLRRAMDAFLYAAPPVEIAIATASAVPERLPGLSRSVGDAGIVIVYQSMVAGYLAPSERSAYEAAMDRWLESARPGGALWTSLEIGDSTDGAFGTRIEARFAERGVLRTLELARTGYHPETLAVDRDAERELARVFARG